MESKHACMIIMSNHIIFTWWISYFAWNWFRFPGRNQHNCPVRSPVWRLWIPLFDLGGGSYQNTKILYHRDNLLGECHAHCRFYEILNLSSLSKSKLCKIQSKVFAPVIQSISFVCLCFRCCWTCSRR